ncbi:ABC-type transport auxiliary lipoprotein family protein [Primorskyibacter sp. S87]|uniref:ABC-type transport auxiliary lipoprotein family protein n=1 Tax=Primorskyibacter sp. S87 TaxID=3415126 RepID=UPI003C7AE914
MNRVVLPIFLVLSLAVSGCTGLGTLNRASKPNDLYALTPKSTFSSNLPRIKQQIVVEEPTATAAVNTDQIAVQPTPLQVQYLPQARWVDRAPLIVQALLIESFENTGKVAAVGRSAVGLRADYHVVTDLREFQAHVLTGADDKPVLRVNVRINVKIVEAYDDKIIASNSFEALEVSASDDAGDLAIAFDEALGDTMRKAVEWSIRRIHTHAVNNPRPALPPLPEG